MPYLEIIKVLIVHYNIVNDDYQLDSRTLYPFVPNKLLGQLLDISSKSFISLKSFNSEFLYIGVWLLIKILNYWRLKIK